MADDVFDWAVRGELDVVADCAVAEPDHPFGSGGDLRVVGDKQDRHVVFGAQAGEQVEDAGGGGGVEVAGGLVGEQQGGGVDQGAGERQPQQVKPDRIIHRLTPAGRAELDRWLGEPAVPARGYRDEFILKVMAAVRSADPAVLPGVLSRQRACLLRQLHALAGARGTSTTAVDSLLITAAELHIRADLGVVDAAGRTLTAGSATAVSGQSSPGQAPSQTAAG